MLMFPIFLSKLRIRSLQDKSQAHLSKMASKKVIRGHLESYLQQFASVTLWSTAIWKFISSQSKKLSAEIYPLSSLYQ